jgi:putative FmdB family regulatory protein
MPIYEYRCYCGDRKEVHLRLSELDDVKVICDCGDTMYRIISKVQARPQVVEYYSENADAHFTGPRQKARILKEKGLSEAGDMKIKDFTHGR